MQLHVYVIAKSCCINLYTYHIYLSVYLSIYLSVYLSTYLSASLSIYRPERNVLQIHTLVEDVEFDGSCSYFFSLRRRPAKPWWPDSRQLKRRRAGSSWPRRKQGMRRDA